MVSACFWRGRLCFGRGRLTTRDRGFVCLYTRVHTHKLLGYLMWAQVQDGHLESLKNPDRLKRSIHVDRIGVHSIFVCIYAGLRVLMIWATCLFSFNMSFLLRKEKMWRQQQTTVTHLGQNQRLHLESSKQNYYIISLQAIIKAIFIQSLILSDGCSMYKREPNPEPLPRLW